MKILDLGCGKKKIKDGKNIVIGVDKIISENVDVVWDLEKTPWPFKDNEFDMVNACHVLEHLSDTLKMLEEIHRITKNGGKVLIRVPHFTSKLAWGDPSHKRAFSLSTFKHPLITQKFKIIKQRLSWAVKTEEHPCPSLVYFIGKLIDYFANKFPNFCESVWCYWVGGFSEIYVEMEVMK